MFAIIHKFIIHSFVNKVNGGMYMEEEVIKELSIKYNKKEILLKEMLNNAKKLNYSIMQFENLIKEFYLKSMQ